MKKFTVILFFALVCSLFMVACSDEEVKPNNGGGGEAERVK
jgi:hypothetical protein